MTDEEFQSAIDGLLKGDTDGLRAIYEAYVRLIYSVVLNLVRQHEDAEDVTSEFFIKLVRVAGQFKKGSPHKSWLVTIARNMALDFMRKNNREITGYSDAEDSDEPLNIVEKAAANPEDRQLEDKVIASEDMKNAMDTLSPKEKEIVDLKLLGDFKFKEIATMLGQPMGTVTWVYNQAIKKLRRYLVDYE